MRIYLKCDSDGKVLGMIKSGQEPEEFKNRMNCKIIITLNEKDIKDIINLNKRE